MCACPGPTADVPALECTSWSPKTVGTPQVGRSIPDSEQLQSVGLVFVFLLFKSFYLSYAFSLSNF